MKKEILTETTLKQLLNSESKKIENKIINNFEFNLSNIENLFCNAIFTNCSLENIRFSNIEMNSVEFHSCEFNSVFFTSVKLKESKFNDIKIHNLTILDSDISSAIIENLTANNLKLILLTTAFTNKTKFNNCDFGTNSAFDGSGFYNSEFKKCNFNKVSFKDSSFEKITIEDCCFIENQSLNGIEFENCNIIDTTTKQALEKLGINTKHIGDFIMGIEMITQSLQQTNYVYTLLTDFKENLEKQYNSINVIIKPHTNRILARIYFLIENQILNDSLMQETVTKVKKYLEKYFGNNESSLQKEKTAITNLEEYQNFIYNNVGKYKTIELMIQKTIQMHIYDHNQQQINININLHLPSQTNLIIEKPENLNLSQKTEGNSSPCSITLLSN